MKIGRGEFLLVVLLSILKFPESTSAANKGLNAPCTPVSSTTTALEDDSVYEEDDEEEDLSILHGDGHMYRRSIDTDPVAQADECDETQQLKCMNGTCQIHCHEHQIFDSIKQKCLGEAGHGCGRHGRQRFCVPNAKCTLSYCDCVKGYGRKDGYCVEASNYKEFCNEDRPCDKKSGMDCIKGKCECSFGSENQWYESSKHTCYSYPEGECTDDALCANNSFCSVVPDVYHETQTHSIIDGYVKRCQCSRGYILSEKNKSCLGNWGSECHKSPCHENFKCAEGKCQCRSPSYQVLDNTINQCVSLIGSHCSLSEPIVTCVDNAECVAGVCTCKQGYSSGESKKCLLDFGQPCQYTKPAKNTLLSNCNYFRGLTCLNGFCDCLDSIHVYNNNTQSCSLQKQHSPVTVTDSDSQTTNNPRKHNHENSPFVMASSHKPFLHPANKFLFLSLFSWNAFIIW